MKLDAGEQIFHFEVCDLNEISRDIMADWVPLLESHNLSYEIEIPETEYMTRLTLLPIPVFSIICCKIS